MTEKKREFCKSCDFELPKSFINGGYLFHRYKDGSKYCVGCYIKKLGEKNKGELKDGR